MKVKMFRLKTSYQRRRARAARRKGGKYFAAQCWACVEEYRVTLYSFTKIENNLLEKAQVNADEAAFLGTNTSYGASDGAVKRYLINAKRQIYIEL